MSLPRLVFASAAFWLTASLANADEAKPKSVPDDCEAFFEAVADLTAQEVSGTEPIDGGCRMVNVVFDMDAFQRWTIDEIEVTGEDIFGAIAEDRLPAALDLKLSGLRFTPAIDDPVLTYIYEVQQGSFDVRLAYHLDKQTSVLTVEEASLDLGQAGRVIVSGEVTSVSALPDSLEDPGAVAGAEGIYNAGLSRLSIMLDNDGLIESMLVPMIAPVVADGGDPRPAIAAYQEMAVQLIESLPGLDSESAAALTRFIRAFPHPRGTYQLDVTSDEPVTMSEAREGRIPDLPSLADRYIIQAQHTPPD